MALCGVVQGQLGVAEPLLEDLVRLPVADVRAGLRAELEQAQLVEPPQPTARGVVLGVARGERVVRLRVRCAGGALGRRGLARATAAAARVLRLDLVVVDLVEGVVLVGRRDVPAHALHELREQVEQVALVRVARDLRLVLGVLVLHVARGLVAEDPVAVHVAVVLELRLLVALRLDLREPLLHLRKPAALHHVHPRREARLRPLGLRDGDVLGCHDRHPFLDSLRVRRFPRPIMGSWCFPFGDVVGVSRYTPVGLSIME